MINGQASEWLDVTSGVPQGSVMGAVLLIHNDIDNGLLLGYVLSCEINLQSTLQLTNWHIQTNGVGWKEANEF